ncbi:SDR family NAD(P)-dependent oxidoreductase [Christensenella timonensis]|uniref:SDR family NAD(P)-dependent oxidoreductase n=1 Tax=Christensenella timonensis TaxID=1816678 RepID=UPI00082FA518|nr:SDR family NAD(P)-dependent oxidoreductase [Christensenella timonensis]
MKIAIITGASSGMGKEFVKQVSAQKCVEQIWVIARRKERLEELAQEVQTPLRVFAYDLTDMSHIDALKQVMDKEKPGVQLLANCSGFAKFGDFEQVREQDALAMIDLDVRALVALTMACIPHMLPGGHIIQIASTAAFQPLPDMNIYAASKAFVLSYSRALNRELGKKGVSVTAVCPGWTKTEFFDVAQKNASKGAVKNFLFLSKPENVVARALKDAQREKDVSVYGIFNKLHMFFAKILPDSSIMTFWNAMK